MEKSLHCCVTLLVLSLFVSTSKLSAHATTVVKNLNGTVVCSCDVNSVLLNCADGDLESLPDLAECSNLTNVTLAGNFIANLAPLSSLHKLKHLNVSNNELFELDPLASLTHLNTLHASDNILSDLGPLSSLTRLTRLDIFANFISDLSPLATLRNITELHADNNKFADLQPLSYLTQLTIVSISNNRISSLSALSKLQNIISLSMSNNYITNVEPLSRLTNLKLLHAFANFISDISPLSTLTSLMALRLGDNRIEDVSPLSNLLLLEYLSLSSNQIRDISLFSQLTNMQVLQLQYNEISSVVPLASLPKLTLLGLENNQISDIGPLSSLTTLIILRLGQNRISDIAPLRTLTNLAILELPHNKITSLGSLATLTTLLDLDLSSNSVSDVTPLRELSSLTSLYLSSNLIEDLYAISSLTNLITLFAGDNRLSYLDGVASLNRLQTLRLENNLISDLSPLSALSHLSQLGLKNNRISLLAPLSPLTQLTELFLADNVISNVDPLVPLSNLTILDLSSNQIRAISHDVSQMFVGTAATYTEFNPSVCQRMLSPYTQATEIVCDCATGYYGVSSCGSIKEDFLELPAIVSTRSSECYDNPHIVKSFCPSNQVSVENIIGDLSFVQRPTSDIFHINTLKGNVSHVITVSLPWVLSAFEVAQPSFSPIPPVKLSVATGLNTTLPSSDFRTLPNRYIPTDITYNVSQPLPMGITFTNGSHDTWFKGKPNVTSDQSIGVFDITVVATEHFTGQTKVAAHVIMNITTCGVDTCNKHGTCSTHHDNIYQPVCTCHRGFNGTYCETPTDTQIDNHSSLAHWVAPVIVVIVVVLLAGALMVYHWKSKRVKRLKASVGLTEQLLSDRDEELQEIHSSWDIPWDDLTLGREIGTGAFGSVVKAVWQGNEVAVKRMKTSEVDFTAELFEKEVWSMTLLRHPNLVTFYGAGVDTTGLRFLVVEYLANGSLRDVLINPEVTMDWSLQMRICRDIALGMMFLHTRSPPVMHRDLKADNCFVNSSWVVKVGDFGSILRSQNLELPDGIFQHKEERMLSETNEWNPDVTATYGCGTPLWTAPEVLATARHGSSHYGLLADVYSYGIVMFEVTARTSPYKEMESVNMFELLRRIQDGLRPTVPLGISEDFALLMRRCWSSKPISRPSFTEITNWFEPTAGYE